MEQCHIKLRMRNLLGASTDTYQDTLPLRGLYWETRPTKDGEKGLSLRALRRFSLPRLAIKLERAPRIK